MDGIKKVSCVLCQRCEETEITGALSTKEKVTAHQNCLLFSSGLYCRNSPQFDDLFGFSVEDVLEEVKRGSKLLCNKCQMRGATAGCEVRRCKKSYHYPCAVQHRAKTVEDADHGRYGLYCSNHSQQTQENNGSVNGRPSSAGSRTSKSSSEAGSSKRNTSADSTTARRLSACSGGSSSSSCATPSSSKRSSNVRHGQEGPPSKRKWNMILTDDSSNSGYSEPDTEMAIFAPVETDVDENANSVPETQLIRKDNESPTGSTSGNQWEDGSIDGKVIHSDGESESLLLPASQPPSATTAVVSTRTAPALSPSVVLIRTNVEVSQRTDGGSSPGQSPVHSPAEHAAGPPVPQQSSAGPPPSPRPSKPLPVTRSPARTSSAIGISLPSSSSAPLAPPSDPEPSVDSTSFWKKCNAAGCTQALFTGFINEMNDISSRIQSDLASQEDYDHALTVMTASGKLAERVAKQQEELQRKQTELQKATAAMKEVVSALRTRVHQQIL